MSSVEKKIDKSVETERIEALFRELDSDGDGTINIKDLTHALKKHKLPERTAVVINLFYKI